MADQGVRVDQSADSGDELGSGGGGGSGPSGGGAPGAPDAKDAPGTKGVPSDGAGGSPGGSDGPPPSAGTDENPLDDPKDGPPTAVDDGGVGGEGLVGAGGSGGDGGGGLFGGLADAAGDVADALDDASDQAGDAAGDAADTAGDVYDQGEDLAHGTYNDDTAGDAIDDAARGAGDTFRDASDAVNELYDDSGVEAPVADSVADAREAGAAVVPDVVEEAYDRGEDRAHQTYDDVEEEVAETYEDAGTLDSDGEHWGGLAGTPDLGPPAAFDTRLDEDARDAIDDAARDAGDTFRDASDAVNELYDDSGVGAPIADAREAGAAVVPDVVEDVYDQGEDMAHQTYDDVVEEVVETYEDASVFRYHDGEHFGGLVGTPDHWVQPLVDGAENVAETAGDWYEKSGVEVGGFGTGAAGDGAGESSVPDLDEYGRGYGSGAPDPLAPDGGLAGGVAETAELAAEEEAQRVAHEVDDLAADPGPVEVPGHAIEAPEPIEALDPIDLEAAGEVDEVIEPV